MVDEFSKNLAFLEKLLKKEENRFCADCRRKSPCWASTTFGCFICIKCSGFHRELGTHITKVRSVNLDKWKKEDIQLYSKMNNEKANKYWEYRLKDFNFDKLQTDDYKLNEFIKDKYVKKLWVKKKKLDPATLISQGKEDSDENVDKEEKIEKIEKNEKNGKKEKINNIQNEKDSKNEKHTASKLLDSPVKTPSLMGFNDNKISLSTKNKQVPSSLIEFNEFEEANCNIAPPQYNSSLIDLNSNQNFNDMKYKEKTDNIFKLFDNPTNNSQNNLVNNNQTLPFNNTTNNINYNSFPQINIQNSYFNANTGYQMQKIQNTPQNQYYNNQYNNNGNYNMYQNNFYQHQNMQYQGQNIQNQGQIFPNTNINNNSNINLNFSGSNGFNSGMANNNMNSFNNLELTKNNNSYNQDSINLNFSGSNGFNSGKVNNNMNSFNKLEQQTKNNQDPFKGLVNFK